MGRLFDEFRRELRVNCCRRTSMDDELIAFGRRSTPDFSLAGLQVRARVVSVHDGDSVRVVFRFNGSLYQFQVRIMHVDTPEINKADQHEAAIRARNRLIQLFRPTVDASTLRSVKDIERLFDAQPTLVTLVCSEFDKYGRVLGTFQTDDGLDPAQVLLHEGLANAYEGKKKLAF